MKLSELSCGESGVVTHLSDLPTATRKKLMVMGLVPNTEITVVRFAPLGDPLQVRVNIALRKQIAADIEVEAH